MDLTGHKICVTGGAGFLGSAICKKLSQRGIGDDKLIVPRSREYDLTDQNDCRRLFDQQGPDVVMHLAADVGGIGANMRHPGRFFYANLAMGLHLVEAARQHHVAKFVHVGSVCAYPKFAAVPFKEEDLWQGYPEETNAPYGVAKKALFVMLDGYKREYGLNSAAVVPVNLYGPGDDFDLESSHVIPALIRKCVEARDRGDDHIVCWGTGEASREFLYVDDAAEAIIRAAECVDDPDPINLGTGREITIGKLVELIAELTEFRGRIDWDRSKPDGQPRRCLDVSRAARVLDWRAQTSLEEGLKTTIEWWQQCGVQV